MQWLRDKVPAKAKKAYAGPGRVLSFCRDDTRVAAHLRIILVYYRNSFHESARGATRKENHPQCLSVISIHAPCAGGDAGKYYLTLFDDISIHAPLRGGRRLDSVPHNRHSVFQSTPPCAGGDPAWSTGAVFSRLFQSTPPCAGGDCVMSIKTLPNFYFNPRPPARGATAKLYNFQNHCNLFCITFLPIRLLNPI